MVSDHLCRQHACGNPDHIEPVTSKENTRRGNLLKIQETERARIRQLVSAGRTRQSLAEEYGVMRQTIYKIIREQQEVLVLERGK